MNHKALIIFLFALMLSSCGEYQALLKSRDPELKYQKALEYFDAKEYTKAQTLLDDVSSYYKGTERSEDVLVYLARCYMGQKDYTTAAEYYATYIRNYPKGRYSTEAHYQVGNCYYQDAPDARLDQDITHKAIAALTQFTELYADSPYADDAYREIQELRNKLAYKELCSARLYYNLGSYLGNNYLSCEIVAKNAIRDYPDCQYLEELAWLVVQAKYEQVVNSVEEKKLERARAAEDECYNFIGEYPESKYKAKAEKIITQMHKIIKD